MTTYKLCLYVVGQEVLAEMPLVKVIREGLTSLFEGRYLLEVVDVTKYPQAAIEEGVFFTPTLVRFEPVPKKKIIGNFSNGERVLQTLRLIEEGASP